MRLSVLLEKRRTSILRQWRDRALAVHPPDAAGLLRAQTDRFANPLGHAVEESTASTLDGLIAGRPAEELRDALAKLVRIRAVQDFSPSRALAFLFQLKAIVREELAGELDVGQVREDLALFDTAVDELALASFDLYVSCRTEVFEVRTNEMRRRTSRVLQLIQRGSAADDRPVPADARGLDGKGGHGA